MLAKQHCCETMAFQVEHRCDQHPDPFDCLDALVFHSAESDEYGLILHGAGGLALIQYCPWCGTRLKD